MRSLIFIVGEWEESALAVVTNVLPNKSVAQILAVVVAADTGAPLDLAEAVGNMRLVIVTPRNANGKDEILIALTKQRSIADRDTRAVDQNVSEVSVAIESAVIVKSLECPHTVTLIITWTLYVL